jgi:hypothetical protein
VAVVAPEVDRVASHRRGIHAQPASLEAPAEPGRPSGPGLGICPLRAGSPRNIGTAPDSSSAASTRPRVAGAQGVVALPWPGPGRRDTSTRLATPSHAATASVARRPWRDRARGFMQPLLPRRANDE